MRAATRWRVVIGLGLVTLVGGGCVTDVEPPTQILWEAELVGEPDHPIVRGSAAAVSTDRVVRASILVTDLPPGTFSWGYFRGTCEAPDDLVGFTGQYDELVPIDEDVGGEASVETEIGAPMPRGSSYHARVWAPDDGDWLTCGDFEEWR
jgi:hypothetical protein